MTSSRRSRSAISILIAVAILGVVGIATVAQGATSIELWQDYGGFPTVADDLLKRWAAMVESNKSR